MLAAGCRADDDVEGTRITVRVESSNQNDDANTWDIDVTG